MGFKIQNGLRLGWRAPGLGLGLWGLALWGVRAEGLGRQSPRALNLDSLPLSSGHIIIVYIIIGYKYWGKIGIMEKKMETTIMGYIGLYRDYYLGTSSQIIVLNESTFGGKLG